MKIRILIVMLLLASPALAQKEYWRDSSGRLTGTADQQGDRTTFRDASGRMTGTANSRATVSPSATRRAA
jgi:YD repeat-containing protein